MELTDKERERFAQWLTERIKDVDDAVTHYRKQPDAHMYRAYAETYQLASSHFQFVAGILRQEQHEQCVQS